MNNCMYSKFNFSFSMLKTWSSSYGILLIVSNIKGKNSNYLIARVVILLELYN